MLLPNNYGIVFYICKFYTCKSHLHMHDEGGICCDGDRMEWHGFWTILISRWGSSWPIVDSTFGSQTREGPNTAATINLSIQRIRFHFSSSFNLTSISPKCGLLHGKWALPYLGASPLYLIVSMDELTKVYVISEIFCRLIGLGHGMNWWNMNSLPLLGLCIPRQARKCIMLVIPW